jgi:hypothetical protein
MNTLSEFLQLSFDQKCNWVVQHGDYIATHEANGLKVYLYSGSGYFMEIYYSPVQKKVQLVNAFDSRAGMEPYLEMISLSELNLPVM